MLRNLLKLIVRKFSTGGTNNPLLLIAQREYWKVIRKKSFWVLILLLPTFYIVVSIISGSSASTVEKKIAEQAKGAKRIIIVDQSGLIAPALMQPPLEPGIDAQAAQQAVQQDKADAAIIYPADLAKDQTIRVFAVDTGIISRGRFDAIGQTLLKQSILATLPNPADAGLVAQPPKVQTTIYANGQKIVTSIEAYILPIVAVVIYFLLTITSVSYMLMAIAEEKENRMIETIRSMVTPKQLIWGKLLAMVGLAFTQLVILAIYGIIAYNVSSKILPISINWSLVDIGVWQAILTGFFIVGGFTFMASLMVGIGAAMPSYRDAQQASPLFIITSILPIYFATVLLADPSGMVAKITSYVPLMSPLVLTFRASVGALPIWEQFLGIAATVIYVAIGLYLAFKLFELGSLETSKKVNIKSLLRRSL